MVAGSEVVRELHLGLHRVRRGNLPQLVQEVEGIDVPPVQEAPEEGPSPLMPEETQTLSAYPAAWARALSLRRLR